MRIIETTRTLYRFEELSDDAKERAREWWRAGESSDNFYAECVIDDAATIADLFGLDIRQTRNKNGSYSPTVYYSGFWGQGDGACFEGYYSYKPGGLKAVKEYAPRDTDLHIIVADLQKIQARYFYKLTATCKHRGHYQHSGCMSVDVAGDVDIYYGDFTAPEDEITDALRGFADWIYTRLEQDYDWRNADPQVDESIICNEYEFTARGGIV